MPPTNPQQRRSPRFLWRTPLLVSWGGPGGLKVREHAETEIVNAHGGLLRLDTLLPIGAHLDLIHPQTNDHQTARVVWGRKGADGKARAGIELGSPSSTFWGIYIPF
jgi:hypothetical protein